MKWVLRISGVLAGVLLAAVLVLYAMGHRAGAGHYSASVEISAAPERIWPWLADGERAKQWVSWLVDVKRSGSGKNGVGDKEIWVLKDPNMNDQLIPVEGTCTEYVKPSRLSVRLSSADFTGDQTYVLTPAAGGRTRLDIDSHFAFPNRFAQLMEPLVARAAKKKMEQDLSRLKSVVEASPAT